MTDHPADAAARLRAFRTSWNDDDVIDDESGLTAADLDAILTRIEAMKDTVSIRQIDLNDPRAMDQLKD